ncbi:MAG: hypothetical protein V4695_11390 [Pseudomonadota bacterium]
MNGVDRTVLVTPDGQAENEVNDVDRDTQTPATREQINAFPTALSESPKLQ